MDKKDIDEENTKTAKMLHSSFSIDYSLLNDKYCTKEDMDELVCKLNSNIDQIAHDINNMDKKFKEEIKNTDSLLYDQIKTNSSMFNIIFDRLDTMSKEIEKLKSNDLKMNIVSYILILLWLVSFLIVKIS